MKPISPVCPTLETPEVVVAKHQPQYQPLPSFQYGDPEGTIVTRWGMSWRERIQILLHGNIWLEMLTFHQKVQPVMLHAKCPIDHEALKEESYE